MDTIRDGGSNGDGQTECTEGGASRVTEHPSPGVEGTGSTQNRANPDMGGESDARRQQLEKKRAYWKKWYDAGGKVKVAASRKKNGQVSED